MQKEREILKKYLPPEAVLAVSDIFHANENLYLKISRARSTKLGDYRWFPGDIHRISINHNLNPYQFLLTLLHEIAHFYTHKEFGRRVKPHGKEWKMFFGNLIRQFIKTGAFPAELVPELEIYARNPRASTGADGQLFVKLNAYNQESGDPKKYVFELLPGSYFAFENGQTFQLQEKRRTRYKCINISNNRTYLVHKNARVYPLKNPR